MKFTQLRIGQPFRHKGQVYRKTSPLMAEIENDGQQRLIPRSADVEPVDAQLAQTVAEAPVNIPVTQLDRAMQQLAGDINDIIAESGLDAAQVSRLLRQLQTAFVKARHNLDLP